MRREKESISAVLILLICGFVGVLNISGENAGATNVSGTQYDGAGGPWTLAGSPYIVVGDVHVPGGETLTIEPGVQVRFDGKFSIDVSGGLHAVGTPTSRIAITSNKTVPAPGDWYRIFFFPNLPVELSYVDISYADEAIRFWPWGNSLNISNNNIENNKYSVYLEGPSSNNIISGNNISNNDYGIYIYQSSNYNITGNNVSQNKNRGIFLFDSSNINITGNNLINAGIAISGTQLSHYNSHNIPPDNTVNGKPVYYYKDCSGIDIDGIPVGQVILANCTGVDVRNLKISNPGGGILVAYSNNTNVIGNNISSNAGGIGIFSSVYNNISNNNVSSNRGDGIHLQLSSNNDIKDNYVSSNNYDGIYLYSSSSNNIITGNNVLDNKNGIVIHLSSNNNKIYHNNLNNVFSDASDDSIGNIWNDTYSQIPLRGGNYWSDWSPTCIDNMNGPSQDISGADEICDEHYHINVNTIDYYPLKNPWVGVVPPVDSTPPDALTLAAGTVTSTSVQLQWTAVADNNSDPASGPASEYDIRYSWGGGCPITDPGTWATAYQATGEPAPQAMGSAESFTITGLLEGTAYCFAIKVGDEVPNWSPLSNNLLATTLTVPVDTEKPGISNVKIEPRSQVQGGSVNITADVTDNSGTVDDVHVRIVSPDGNVIGNFTMEKAGGNEYYYIFNIDSDADTGNYKFVIWAEDANGNIEKSAETDFTVTPTTKAPGPDFLRDWWWLILILAIIVVFLILLLLLKIRKGPEETKVETVGHQK